jgi:2-keto-4-pentenoate hydratase/2-oxohepta-3-ene-1,7-dioic acid hydratase in catechol pathway
VAKIARFRTEDGAVRYGVLEGEDTLRVIDGGPFGDRRPTEVTVPLAQVRLLAPVEPPNIIAIGLNYRAHAIESGAPMPERPVIFIKATTALCGPDDAIVLPKMAPNEVDYECELAIVIGKTARHVPVESALDYALGYTCGHDVSARDCQLRLDAQWARGKSFDTFAPLGPWIETELDPDNAPIRTRLNGTVMQESNTSDLIFSCPELIAYLSANMTLLPGTVIMTGTPSGVGFARKPPVFLRAGDVVEIEVDGIGTLRNTVIAEA